MTDVQAPEPVDGPNARQRLVRALVHPGRGQITAAVLLAVLGTAGVTQVRIAGTDDDLAGLRQADLIQALNGLQAASQRKDQDIRDLQRTRDSLRDNNARTSTALNSPRSWQASNRAQPAFRTIPFVSVVISGLFSVIGMVACP